MIHDKNRRLVITSVIVGFIIIVLIMVGLFLNNLREENSGDRIKINNYDTYVKNLSSSEREAIETTLYSTVAFNVSDDEQIKAIDDAVIREASYNQSLNNRIYTTKFIVDIESIKQSYEIQDLYSNQDPEQSGLHDYTTLALCLSTDKLKYGEFVCQDRISQEKGLTQSDPILQYLPVSTLEYTLRVDPTSKDLKLIAEISLSEIDYKLGEEAAVEQYKLALNEWFLTKDLDISLYDIRYEY